MVVLARALQWCTEWLGASPSILCSAVQDLCQCLESLMERDNLLEASMLEVVREEPEASPTPTEEAVLLGEDPEPLEEWAIALHAPDKPEEASEPDDTVGLGVIVAAPQNMWTWVLPPPPGFARLLAVRSAPPSLKDADTPLGIPRGAWLDLTSLGSTQIVIVRNSLAGELEYYYKDRVISRMSLCLTPHYIPGQPGTNWELREY